MIALLGVLSTRTASLREKDASYAAMEKELQKEYDDMESNISDEEEKLADLEDKYYDKFSAMETALAKLQEKQNALGQLLGS